VKHSKLINDHLRRVLSEYFRLESRPEKSSRLTDPGKKALRPCIDRRHRVLLLQK